MSASNNKKSRRGNYVDPNERIKIQQSFNKAMTEGLEKGLSYEEILKNFEKDESHRKLLARQK